MINKSVPFFSYHPDHLGSTGYVTDEKALRYEHLAYFPFGETWVQEANATWRVPYQFTGKEMDSETGLYYFGARYYDPRTSVWQSPDPILDKYLPTGNKEKDAKLPGMGGVFNSRNLELYSYAGLSPLNYVDPDGKRIAVIFNGSTFGQFSTKFGATSAGNPLGHVAIAVEGKGVYSFGNTTKFGSSLTTYLKEQAKKRDNQVFIINTTPEQDAKIMKYLSTQKDDVNAYPDNCANRVNQALDAGGVDTNISQTISPSGAVGLSLELQANSPAGPFPTDTAKVGGQAVDNMGGSILSIPKSQTPVLPAELRAFDPAQ